MRCKQCDSLLWHQPAATAGAGRCCSECGAPYRPSDFDFVRGKVRFACPHCGTGYYGTSPRGHLEPPAFECVTCHSAIHMDDCILTPEGVEGDGDAAVRLKVIPWLGRDGIVSRWLRTMVLGLATPSRIPEQQEGAPRAAAALGFLATHAALSALPSGLCCAAIGIMASVPGGGARFFTAMFATEIGALLIGTPVCAAVLALFGAVGARLASPRHQRSFMHDYATACYAAGPLVFFSLPLLGWLAPIWWFISSGIALAAARPPESRGGVLIASIAAFFVLPVLALVVVIAVN